MAYAKTDPGIRRSRLSSLVGLLWAFFWRRWMIGPDGHKRRVVRVKGWRTAIIESDWEMRQTITPCFSIFGWQFD